MKVLCPIDFSNSSLNATRWIASFLNDIGDSELHLTHYIYVIRRASMFLSVEDIFIQRAKRDMETLIEELKTKAPNIKIENSIYKAHPKEAIVSKSRKDDFDMIVTGSTGLTALKNMTIGSVTAYVMKHSKVPVFAIPENSGYNGLDRLALAVDDEILGRLSTLSIVRDICTITNSELHVVHITEKNESPFEYDPGIDLFLEI